MRGKGRWPRSFPEANAERGALIHKRWGGGLAEQLSAEEISRLHLLDTIVGAWVHYKYSDSDADFERWLRETKGTEMVTECEAIEAAEEETR